MFEIVSRGARGIAMIMVQGRRGTCRSGLDGLVFATVIIHVPWNFESPVKDLGGPEGVLVGSTTL